MRIVQARVALVLAVGASVVLAGCSGSKDTPAPTVTTTPTSAAARKTSPPTPAVPVVWPLTGVATKKVADRPALGIKVENSTEARPQTGLEDADMVWEEVVEGGITRFMAVYQSHEAPRVEPIRSVRPMDPVIFAPFHGILAFSGGQPPFVKAVKDAGIQALTMDGGSPGFYRDPNRVAPHNVYASTKDFWAQADSSRTSPPPEQFRFATKASGATAVEDGTTGKKVAIRMSAGYQPGWTYDATKHVYLRSELGKPSVSTDGVRLSGTNVVVLRVKLVETKYKDPAGNPVPETELSGTGSAVILSGGKAVKATWTKKSTTSVLTLTVDGADVLLAPGTTWVELVPTSSGAVTVS